MGEQRAAARARIGDGSRRGNRGTEATDREGEGGRRTVADGGRARPTPGGGGSGSGSGRLRAGEEIATAGRGDCGGSG